MHLDEAEAGIELRMCEPHLSGRRSAFFPQAEKIFREVEVLLYYLLSIYICTIIRVERYYVME